MQLSVQCTGDTVSGNGSRNVTLRPDPQTQGGVSSTDDLRLTLAAGDPDFDTFAKGQTYTLTVS